MFEQFSRCHDYNLKCFYGWPPRDDATAVLGILPRCQECALCLVMCLVPGAVHVIHKIAVGTHIPPKSLHTVGSCAAVAHSVAVSVT